MNKKTILKKLKRVLIVTLTIGIFGTAIVKNIDYAKAYTPKAGTVAGSGCRVRSAPNTSSAIVASLNQGYPVTIIGESAKDSSGYVWYNIVFSKDDSSLSGWMRADLINTTLSPSDTPSSDTAFESHLTAQGFPESYKRYLRALHEIHPNWVFNSYNTGLSWSEAIAGEVAVVSRNLVPINNVASWKSLADGAYNWSTGEWYQYESGWAAASQELIAYCMDPRNFLSNDDRIYMFQNLGWNNSETMDGIRQILASTAMQGDFPTIFYNAGKDYGVSAYHLAARADQETAGGRSGSVTGTYKNYFNIGATGSNPVQAAVDYAKNKGWDTAEKSIRGGAEFIGGSYISKGQSNLYLQKFDFVADGGYFWHQYMGNVLAPQHESAKLAKSAELIERSANLTFTIPVFSGMPETPVAVPTADGNPNNLLDSITVSGYELTPGFSRGVTTYDVIVPEGTTQVTIGATPVVPSASVSGTGTVTLNATGVTSIRIVCKADYANGKERVYTVNVAKSGSASGGGSSSGGSSGGGSSGGGSSNGGGSSTPALQKGDLTGDNKRSAADLVYMKKYIVGLISLNSSQLQAADLNGDGRVSAADLVLLKKHIVGLITLS